MRYKNCYLFYCLCGRSASVIQNKQKQHFGQPEMRELSGKPKLSKMEKVVLFCQCLKNKPGSEIFLSLVLVLPYFSSSCQRNPEVFLPLWFTPLCRITVWTSSFSCLGDQVPQLRNGILAQEGSASPRQTCLTPCWGCDYSLQMCSDPRPKFTGRSCPQQALPCFSRADPELQQGNTIHAHQKRRPWSFSHSLPPKLKIPQFATL